MSERSSTHLALVVSVLAVLVAVFGEFRQDDKQLRERVARLEARLDAVHETCCGELRHASAESWNKLLPMGQQREEILRKGRKG